MWAVMIDSLSPTLFYSTMSDIIAKVVDSGNLYLIIIFLSYVVVSKIIDNRRDKNKITISNELTTSIQNLQVLLNKVVCDIIENDKQKCKNAIRTSMGTLALSLIEFSTHTIIGDDVNKNKDNIISDIDSIINSNYYIVYNELGLYNNKNIKVNTYLKESWINELKKDLELIILDLQISKINKISALTNRIALRCKTYETYIINKTFG